MGKKIELETSSLPYPTTKNICQLKWNIRWRWEMIQVGKAKLWLLEATKIKTWGNIVKKKKN